MQPLDTIRSYSLEAESALRKAAGQVGLQLFIGSCELPYHLFFDAMPPGHRAFFKSLLTHYQTPDCICVHAGVHPSFPATDPQFHPRDSLIWGVREFRTLTPAPRLSSTVTATIPSCGRMAGRCRKLSVGRSESTRFRMGS